MVPLPPSPFLHLRDPLAYAKPETRNPCDVLHALGCAPVSHTQPDVEIQGERNSGGSGGGWCGLIYLFIYSFIYLFM